MRFDSNNPSIINLYIWWRCIILSLVFLTILRIIFFLFHFSSNNINLAATIISLFNGIRFDISTLSYLFIPIWIVIIFLSLPCFNQKSFLFFRFFFKYYLILILLISTIIYIIDIGFYYEFNTRINYLAIEYLPYFESTLSTIISVFPYNILFLLIFCFFGNHQLKQSTCYCLSHYFFQNTKH